MAQYILAIDQGTTGTTVALVDSVGAVAFKVSKEYRQIYPQPGWVEHNPEDIWQSVLSCLDEILRRFPAPGSEIMGIGITNQRETVVAWDRETGQSFGNAIVWQCRRTAKMCADLEKKGWGPTIQAKTGLVLDPYFSATKMTWILKHRPEAKAAAKKGRLCFGTVDSFLIWRLSGGVVHKTDVSNASRTLLMNIHTGEWDAQLLKLFGVPQTSLPQIVPSSGELARTVPLGQLAGGVAISGVAGDQQAALFGQLGLGKGDAKCTYGTGSFLLMNTGSQPVRSRAGCLTTVAWQLAGEAKLTYALEGGAFVCGAAVQWLRDGLGFFSESSAIEELAASVGSTEGVEFVPALTGLGAPYWDAEARGLISGLTRGTTRAHIARATLEGMALQNVDILRAMESDLGSKLRSVKVDGGAAANNLLMQMQADYLGVPIVRPKMLETTVLGAAFLAGLGVGYWQNIKALTQVWQEDRTFLPELPKALRGRRLSSWHGAIARTTDKGNAASANSARSQKPKNQPERKLKKKRSRTSAGKGRPRRPSVAKRT